MGKTNQTKAEVSKKELAKAGDADHYSDLEDDELLALVFADEEGSKPVSKPKRKHKSLPKEPSKVNVLYLGHIRSFILLSASLTILQQMDFTKTKFQSF